MLSILHTFITSSSISGDYVNSKEYRKPEWVTRMEEIQKRLSGEQVSPYLTLFFTQLMLVCRAKAICQVHPRDQRGSDQGRHEG